VEIGEEVVGVSGCVHVRRGFAQHLQRVSICIVIGTAISTPILSHIDGTIIKQEHYMYVQKRLIFILGEGLSVSAPPFPP